MSLLLVSLITLVALDILLRVWKVLPVEDRNVDERVVNAVDYITGSDLTEWDKLLISDETYQERLENIKSLYLEVVDHASAEDERSYPEASPLMIRSCSTCGRKGRRRRNGHPFCYDCEHEPWMWE